VCRPTSHNPGEPRYTPAGLHGRGSDDDDHQAGAGVWRGGVTRASGRWDRLGVGVALAREETYVKYAEDLTRFATGLVGPADAADVVSSAVLGCLWSKHWPMVEDQRAYLFRAVMNEARRSHRGAMRRALREARCATTQSVPPVELHPEVLAAVRRLSVRQRAAVVLTYWADLDPTGVGELLGISDGAVRRHLARARRRLRELLDE